MEIAVAVRIFPENEEYWNKKIAGGIYSAGNFGMEI